MGNEEEFRFKQEEDYFEWDLFDQPLPNNLVENANLLAIHNANNQPIPPSNSASLSIPETPVNPFPTNHQQYPFVPQLDTDYQQETIDDSYNSPDYQHGPSYINQPQTSRQEMVQFPYNGLTSMVNANSNIIMPKVQAQFVDKNICNVCGKRITRDMGRHMRTHHPDSRFKCEFPARQCDHRSRKFNRPYDFKKHLLNKHFIFDNAEHKKEQNLSNKLNQWGMCPCGIRFLSDNWLSDHILTKNQSQKCPLIRNNR